MPNFTLLGSTAIVKKASAHAKAFSLFLLFFLSFSGALFAHTVDYFTTCAYFCKGSDVIVKAKVSNTNSGTRYNWQYKDNSNSWKCFKDGNNTINGAVFSASGVKSSGTNNPPTLNIDNSTTVLNGVDVRLIMSDNADPCNVSSSSSNLWGDDKSQELRILTNCADVAIYCNGGNPLKLGNLVWNDLNGNNVKDANEPIVPGATVKLYRDTDNSNTPDSNTPLATTTTNSSGLYYFESLAAGKYIVGVIIPTGYTRGAPSSVDPDNNVDNDNNGTTLIGSSNAGGEIRTKAITLSSGDEPTNDGDGNNGNLTLDVALCPAPVVNNLKLGNLVWNDLNGNNVRDANEPVVPGATVKLYRDTDNSNTPDSNTPLSTTTTNSSGLYYFDNLAPGKYLIGVIIPTGYTRGAPSSIDPDNNVDNDNNGTTLIGSSNAGGEIRTKAITLSSGDEPTNDGDGNNNSNLTLDVALCPAPVVANLRLGNQVWNDKDGDGRRDDNEPGIPGATVSLYRETTGDNLPDGAAINTDVTDATGKYLFTNLAPGRYIASMPILPGYQQSPNDSAGSYRTTTLVPNNNVDNDNNLVRLVGNNKAGEGVLYTNAITLSAGDEPTTDGDDANGNLTFDLAECGNAAIGDFVWNDLNGNGIQEAGEPGINGVLVRITFSDGRFDEELTHSYLGKAGYYDFINLGPGTYKLTFTTPAGLIPSPANVAGVSDALDSDPVNGSATTTIAADQSDFTIDAGFKSPTTIVKLKLGNLVWNDLNGNNVKESTEPVVAGATVKLYRDSDNNNAPDDLTPIATTTTNSNGLYLFENLVAGNYIVGVIIPAGYTKGATSTIDPDNNVDDDNNGVNQIGSDQPGGEVRSLAITLAAGTEPTADGDDNNSNLTLDISLCPLPVVANLKLGNYVWNDNNGNGVKDQTEYGIPNIEVRLFSDNNNGGIPTGSPIKTTTTNSQGYYQFTDLIPGNYIASITILPGYQKSPNTGYTLGDNPNNNIDNDNNAVRPANAQQNQPIYTNPITLTAGGEPSENGNTNNTLDLALCGNLWIGDFVWNDANGNGIQDNGEPGINDVNVKILFPDGVTTDDVNTYTYEGKAGYYDFPRLGPGTFKLTFPTTVNGLTASPAKVGNNDAIDSDPVNGVATVVLVNQSNLNVDAGFKPNAPVCTSLVLGNYVWNDYDGDGQKDDNEYGLACITVSLYHDNDNNNIPDNATPIATTVTNWQGYYRFTDLTPGRYIASIPVLAGYQPGGQRASSIDPNNNVDQDNNAINRVGNTLYTNAITLTEGGEPNGNTNNTLDLALCGTIDLGDFVWNDANGNGIQDAGEKGINGVEVTIVFPDGSITSQDTRRVTDSFNLNADKDGYYVYPRLGPGTFILYFKTPNGFSPSPTNSGNNDAKDSDPYFGFKIVTLTSASSNYTVDAGYTDKHSGCYNNCNHNSCGHSRCGNGSNNRSSTPPPAPVVCDLKVTLDAKDPLCFNNRTGSVVATVTGATGNLVYNWSNGSNGNKLMNIASGTYAVKVTDQSTGCEVTSEPVTLNNPDKIATTISSPLTNGYNITCNGSNTGRIDLGVTGGKGAYTYQWNNGATTQDVSGLVAGKYVVTVKDEVGCPTTATITLTEPASKLEATAAVTQPDCSKQTGAVTLNVTGGVAPYSYDWSNGSKGAAVDQLAAGKYSVTIQDAAGCQVTRTFELKNSDLVVKATTNRNTITAGSTDAAMLQAEATGGAGNYTYTWTTAPGIIETAKATTSVTPTATTAYVVTVKDAKGCTATTTVTVNVAAQAVTASKEPIVPVVAVEKVRVTPNPSTGNFNVLLSGFTQGKVEIKIMDASGKNVMVKDVTVGSLQTMVPFNLTRAPKGVYIVNVVSGDKSYKEKLILE